MSQGIRSPSPVPCSEPNCNRRERIVRGLCSKHYKQRKKTGALPPLRPQPTLADRLWALADKNGPVMRPGLTPCWEWRGARNAYNYGQIRSGETGQRMIMAHRVAWEVTHGQPVPEGLYICHSCDYPPCVNPEHLWSGTQASNVADMMSKNRGPKPRGLTHCPQGHEYTPENTYINPSGHGICRICNRDSCLRAYHRKKAVA